MKTLPDEKSILSNGAAPKKPKGLFFLSDIPLDRIYDPEMQAAIARRVDVPLAPLTAELYRQFPRAWPDVEIIFAGWGMPVMDEEFLSRFPRLKVIFYGAGSIKNHVTDAFWQSGIRITNAVAANAIPVAEYTCAQIIMGLKMVWQSALAIKRDLRLPKYGLPPGAYRTTVGLLSLGTIGKIVAERLRGNDLHVVAYDPLIPAQDAARLNVTLLPLDEVFARAQVVSCHTPWLPETERMIRGHHFELLQPQATFINTARGAVVAEDEMIAVLQKRPDLLAILDVTYPDPPVPGSPLFTLPNVILTPHIAGSMGHECRRMGCYMVEELERYLAGQPLRYEVSEVQAPFMA
jgi:phosphoglycerate dehydrogenase-like enzyme